MQFKKLFEDNDAVSPVIGVILMVAITVILAAVIGTFVLGLGDQVQQTSPTSQFTFDYDSTEINLTVTHDGGDGIPAEELSVSGDINTSGDTDLTNGQTWDKASAYGIGSSVTAGDSVEIGIDPAASNPEVAVIWNSVDSDRSSTLAEWEN